VESSPAERLAGATTGRLCESAVVGSSAMSNFWRWSQRQPDHGALAEAAGELMGKLLGADFGLRQRGVFDRGEQTTVERFLGGGRLVRQDGFLDLRADAHHGIQRGHGLLKDHGDFASTNGAPFGFGQLRQRLCARALKRAALRRSPGRRAATSP